METVFATNLEFTEQERNRAVGRAGSHPDRGTGPSVSRPRPTPLATPPSPPIVGQTLLAAYHLRPHAYDLKQLGSALIHTPVHPRNMVGQTSIDRGRSDGCLDAVFATLASGERRRLLEVVLHSAPEPVPSDDLATALAAWTDGKETAAVSDDERMQAAIAVEHVHLPRLSEAELIEYDEAADAVTPADHPAFDDPGIREAVTGDVPAGANSLDDLFAAIADPHRRATLDVLSHQFGPIHEETLARELGAGELDAVEAEVPEAVVERIRTSLRHVHLPHLAVAGLVAYDDGADTVEYLGHPALHVPWMHSVLAPAFRESLTGASDPTGIGEIEGRERVVSFGQSLCERAEDELFCLFTESDLLEAGCLARIRDVARRGTDVYLGTPDPAIGEYVRETAPDVVLWVPNTNWLNLPAAEGNVGRLLLADREAAMLGTIGDDGAGTASERAMVGEGEDNTLVTMVSQLVSPHLDAIDEGGPDVQARLPL